MRIRAQHVTNSDPDLILKNLHTKICIEANDNLIMSSLFKTSMFRKKWSTRSPEQKFLDSRTIFSLLASWFMKKCDNLCLPSIEATFCIPTRSGQWAHATTVRRRITAKYDVQIPFWLRRAIILWILACHRSTKTVPVRCRNVKTLSRSQVCCIIL